MLKGEARILSDKTDPMLVWQLLFSDEMLDHGVEWTNRKLRIMEEKHKYKHNLRELDLTNLKHFRVY